MAEISIGGQTVDADDPCALYQALYAVKLRLIAGEGESEVEMQDPVTRRRIRYSTANMAALDGELLRLSSACERQRSGRPARFAKRFRCMY